MIRNRTLSLLVLAASTLAAAPDVSHAAANLDCLMREIQIAESTTTVGAVRRRCGSPTADPVPPFAPLQAQDATLFQRRVMSEFRAMNEPFALLPHRPSFLLPLSYHRRPSASIAESGANDALETHFQISFKFPVSRPLFDGRVTPFFAYTGRAWWQVYDGSRSRPFREYNHEPEVLLSMPVSGVSLWGWEQRVAIFGFSHQSNGQTVTASRSWNRITAELQFDRGATNWASLRLWQRLKEDAKTSPSDTRGDDNPDITRFLGHAELKLGHVTESRHNLTLVARRSVRSEGKGALQLDWSGPLPESPSLRWHLHLFSGYGDSLIDYNQRVQRIGLGVMLNDWF